MKRMRFFRVVAMLFSVVLLFSLTAAPAYANSAQSHWTGIDSTGAIVVDENCPIEVEKELLTFNIQEFPSNYYRSAEELESYTGRVTAEYTFYNPADYKVTATLVFPFGNLPSYAYFYDSETGERDAFLDTELYGVEVDGEPIDLQVRHTLSHSYDQFSLEKDMPLLSDGHVKDAFYRPDLPVTVYKYTISGVDEQYNAANAAFRWSGDSTKTRILLTEQNGGQLGDDWMQVEMWVRNGESALIYVFGEVPESGIQWTFYENGACEKEIEGTMTLAGSEVITFEEYAMLNYPEDAGILEHDWYNAVVANLNYSSRGFSYGIIGEYVGDLSSTLMRWYEYEITLEPGQRIVNAVTAPIYPSINTNYEPDVFGYTYLLSPAKTWKSFGELEIVVNTPYFISNSSIEGFTKTETGYTVKLDGLPDGELTFDLATSEKPVRKAIPYQTVFTIVIVIICVVIALLVGGVVLTVVLIRKKKAKKTID